MAEQIGYIEALFRYPVKSMAGERLDEAPLGWHGIEGDRRLALRRTDLQTGFPWLQASKLPDLLLFRPVRRQDGTDGVLPTHVRTPDGRELAVFEQALEADIGRRHGAPVQMMHLRSGVFDDASVSVISLETIREVSSAAGQDIDVRRFRPNILVRLLRPEAFQEDGWLGGTLTFGDDADGPRISLTVRDARCSIINLDPDTGRSDPQFLKSVVRMNANNAGVYGTVIRTGRLVVGQSVHLQLSQTP